MRGMERFGWAAVGTEDAAGVLVELDRVVYDRSFPPAACRLRVATLPFYDDYRLYEVAVDAAAPAPPARIYALRTPGHAVPLDWTNGPIYRLNRLAPIRLTAGNVADYARFFFRMVVGRDGHGRYLPAESVEDLVWRDDAGPAKARAAAAMAPFRLATPAAEGAAAPPRDGETQGRAFRLEGRFVFEDALIGATILVDTHGEIRIAEETVLIDALPVAPDDVPSADYPQVEHGPRIPGVSGWTVADAIERERLLAELDPYQLQIALGVNDFVDLRRNLEVRRGRLSCYDDYRLYRLTVSVDGRDRSAFAFYRPGAVQAGGDLVPLNWTSPPLHALNQRAPLRLDTADRIADYLRFFCWAIVGNRDDRFLIVEHPGEIPWRLDAPEDQLSAAVQLVRPLAPGRVAEDASGTSERPGPHEDRPAAAASPERTAATRSIAGRFDVTLIFQGNLYAAELQVGTDGLVQMTDDTPLLQGLAVDEQVTTTAETFVVAKAEIGPSYAATGRELTEPEARAASRQRFAAGEFEAFLRRVNADAEVAEIRLTAAIVEGGWHFSGCRLGKPLKLADVEFQGDIVLDDSHFEGSLALRDCLVLGQVSAVNGFVNGNVTLDGSTIDPTRTPGMPRRHLRALDLDGIEIRGHLSLARLVTVGPLIATHMTVVGELNCGGIDVSLNPVSDLLRAYEADLLSRQPALELTEARQFAERVRREQAQSAAHVAAARFSYSDIGGDVKLGCFRPVNYAGQEDLAGIASPAIVRGSLEAMHCRIGGRLWLEGLACSGDVLFDASVIEGQILASCCHVRFRRNVDSMCRLIIGGDLRFNSAEVKGSILLSGLIVCGGLDVVFAQVLGWIFGRVNDSRVAEGAGPPSIVGGPMRLSGLRAGGIELEAMRIGDAFEMITGEVGRISLEFGVRRAVAKDGEVLTIEPSTIASVRIKSVVVGDRVSFVGARIAPPAGAEAQPYAGDFILSSVRVGTDVLFHGEPAWRVARAASAGALPAGLEVSSTIAGRLDLNGTTIGCSLNLSNVTVGGEIVLNDVGIGADLLCWSLGPDDPTGVAAGSGRRYATGCSGLDMAGLRCDGDADLTGLRIRAEGGAGGGTLEARNLKVGGKLLFCLDPRSRHRTGIPAGAAEPMAIVPGRLDLSAASAGHVIISGKDVGGPDGGPAEPIILDRATFRRFEARTPFERCIDIANMTVDRWEVGDHELSSLLASADKEAFRRSNYLMVEAALRNGGNEEKAAEIYRDMRWNALQHETRRHRQLLERFLGWSTGFGTRSWRPLVWVALPLALLSIWIFSNPANIVTVPDQVSAPTDPALGNGPREAGYHWGAASTLAMLARYNVPVIPLELDRLWAPSADALYLWIPLVGDVLVPGASALGYALVVAVVHWIVWPLFLASIVGFVRYRG